MIEEHGSEADGAAIEFANLMLDHRERERQIEWLRVRAAIASSEYPGSVNLNDGGRPELTLPKGHFLGVAFTIDDPPSRAELDRASVPLTTSGRAMQHRRGLRGQGEPSYAIGAGGGSSIGAGGGSGRGIGIGDGGSVKGGRLGSGGGIGGVPGGGFGFGL